MNKLGITWCDVFDGYKIGWKMKYNTIQKVKKFIIEETDYKFLNWNGKIYEYQENPTGDFFDTGLTVDDL